MWYEALIGNIPPYVTDRMNVLSSEGVTSHGNWLVVEVITKGLTVHLYML